MQKDKPRILISGANGFIGSHIAEAAVQQGWIVHAGMRRTSDASKLSGIRYERFHLDMHQPDALERSLSEAADRFGGFDYVIHCAGVTKPKHHSEFDRGNAYFTRDFAAMAKASQPALQKFIFVSSIAALGPGDPASMNPIDELKEPRPFTPYGASKLKGERLLADIPGLDYLIIRPSAVYGPRDEKFLNFIVPLFKSGFDFRLGPANQRLSFIHVYDLADAVVAACRRECSVRSLNLSDGRSYGQESLNEAIKSALGVKCVVIRIPGTFLRFIGWTAYNTMSLIGKEVHLTHHKMGEVTAMNWVIDISRAKKCLGFNPRYDLRSGIAQALVTSGNKKAQDLATKSKVES